jgi:hypothetical protein
MASGRKLSNTGTRCSRPEVKSVHVCIYSLFTTRMRMCVYIYVCWCMCMYVCKLIFDYIRTTPVATCQVRLKSYVRGLCQIIMSHTYIANMCAALCTQCAYIPMSFRHTYVYTQTYMPANTRMQARQPPILSVTRQPYPHV